MRGLGANARIVGHHRAARVGAAAASGESPAEEHLLALAVVEPHARRVEEALGDPEGPQRVSAYEDVDRGGARQLEAAEERDRGRHRCARAQSLRGSPAAWRRVRWWRRWRRWRGWGRRAREG